MISKYCTLNDFVAIRIVVNDEYINSERLIDGLSSFYQVPKIDVLSFATELNFVSGFEGIENLFLENDKAAFSQIIDPSFKQLLRNLNESSETFQLFARLLKFRLSRNDCTKKGFVLYNVSLLLENFSFVKLFYENAFSVKQFEKILRQKLSAFRKSEQKQKRMQELEEKETAKRTQKKKQEKATKIK